MFENVGSKIKALASALAGVGIFLSLVIGILMVVSGVVGTGFLVMVVGGFGSWVSSAFLYGFGELIDTAMSIDKKLNNVNGSAVQSIVTNAKPAEVSDKVASVTSGTAEDAPSQVEEEPVLTEEERIKMEEEQCAQNEQLRKERRAAGVCQWCGGKFKGFLIVECSECGAPRDY